MAFYLILLGHMSSAKFLHSDTSSGKIPDLRFEKLPLCHPEKVVNHFILDKSPSCNDIKMEKTSSFQGDVFAPQKTLLEVDAVACSIITDHFEDTYYVYFEKYSARVASITLPVSLPLCKQWNLQHHDRELGEFLPVSPRASALSTTNAHNPIYHWPYTTTSTTTNAMLIETSITFNSITLTGQHLLEPQLLCHTTEGYCTSNSAIYIFKPFTLECLVRSDPVVQNATILVHQLPQSMLFQVPGADLAFSSVFQCPSRIESCFLDYLSVQCTSTNFVIASRSNESNSLDMHKIPTTDLLDDSSYLHDAWSLVLAQAFESLSLNVEQELNDLRREFLKLQCINARLQITNLRATQFINPSEALSALLNREAFATMGSLTLQEISCVRVTATLRPSLWIDNRLASRPLFTVYYGNRTRTAQWTHGNYLRWDLRDFTSAHEGHMLFTINNRIFTFLNGTLQDSSTPNLEILGYPSRKIKVSHHNLDARVLAETFHTASSSLDFEFLHQSLQALSTLQHTQLTAHGFNAQEVNRFIAHPVTEKQQHSLLNSVTKFFSPLFPSLLPVFRIFTSFWVIVATALLTLWILGFCITKWRRYCVKNLEDLNSNNQPGVSFDNHAASITNEA